MAVDNSCIRVIRQDHKGVSAARNLGINLANGKYIYFFDADDFVDEDFLEKLLSYAKKYNNALICFGYIKESKGKILFRSFHIKSNYLKNAEAFNFIINNKYSGGYLWNKLFITKIIKESDLRFNEDIRISEDLLFTIEYLDILKEIVYVNEHKYHYIIHQNNTINKKSKSNCMSRIAALHGVKKIFLKNNYDIRAIDYLKERELVSTILYLIKNKENPSEIKDLQKELLKCKIVFIDNGYKYYKVVLTHIYSLLPIYLTTQFYKKKEKDNKK